jgi:hypothetical protein
MVPVSSAAQYSFTGEAADKADENKRAWQCHALLFCRIASGRASNAGWTGQALPFQFAIDVRFMLNLSITLILSKVGQLSG